MRQQTNGARHCFCTFSLLCVKYVVIALYHYMTTLWYSTSRNEVSYGERKVLSTTIQDVGRSDRLSLENVRGSLEAFSFVVTENGVCQLKAYCVSHRLRHYERNTPLVASGS